MLQFSYVKPWMSKKLTSHCSLSFWSSSGLQLALSFCNSLRRCCLWSAGGRAESTRLLLSHISAVALLSSLVDCVGWLDAVDLSGAAALGQWWCWGWAWGGWDCLSGGYNPPRNRTRARSRGPDGESAVRYAVASLHISMSVLMWVGSPMTGLPISWVINTSHLMISQ